MSLVKKLTSKNKPDYEMAASHIISNADFKTFEELVNQDDFLFDFIKNNVSTRLESAVNSSNYRNLIKFLPFYSPSYVEFIAKSLAKFADNDLIAEILEIFKNGSDNEKAYCAKFFSIVKSTAGLNELKEYAYSDFEPLALNCAEALASLEDRELYEKALNTLSSNDDFEKLSAVKFLVAYGDKNAIPSILNVLKTSSMAENIAAEVPYLDNIFNILDFDVNSGLYLVNLIIDGLGEVTSLSQVFDYQLYDVICCLLNNLGSKEALIVLNAKEKFNTLTENDEYLYDEDKNTKNEIFDIKKLLSSIDLNMLENLAEAELDENSDFVLSAIDLVKNEEKLVKLTSSSNQTIVLKSLSALKLLGKLNSVDKNEILKNITDENIKAIIIAL